MTSFILISPEILSKGGGFESLFFLVALFLVLLPVYHLSAVQAAEGNPSTPKSSDPLNKGEQSSHSSGGLVDGSETRRDHRLDGNRPRRLKVRLLSTAACG